MNDTYQAALDYLYQFANFEHKPLNEETAHYITLERPAHLLRLLGDPHHTFPSILIAGTKGKGSVAALCAASLRAAGLKVGLYTSPHLQEFRERMRLLTPVEADGRITRTQLVTLVERMKPAIEQVPGITWYELVTALAFLFFAEQQPDIVVVEVGLGGRLDATNLLQPLVSVITSISLDHTAILGDTLAEIAIEKGGIIKQGVPLVSAEQPPAALAELERLAAERGASLTAVGQHWTYRPHDQPLLATYQPLTIERSGDPAFVPSGTTFDLALRGPHQLENGTVALAALAEVAACFPAVDQTAVGQGFRQVTWPGRLQVLQPQPAGPLILLDSAHNTDSVEKLAAALRSADYADLRLIIGITADKDVSGILTILLPLAQRVIFTTSGHPRAATPESLQQIAVELGYQGESAPDVGVALRRLWTSARADDLICLTGSLFVVGDLLNRWDSLQLAKI